MQIAAIDACPAREATLTPVVRCACYVRISTQDQNSALQIRELRQYAARQGWEILETYQGVISGAKLSRPPASAMHCSGAWRCSRRRKKPHGGASRRQGKRKGTFSTFANEYATSGARRRASW